MPAAKLAAMPLSSGLDALAKNEVDAVIEAAHEQIARARFAAFGTGLYPDATFTLRLSYGSVRGWDENGAAVEPLTRYSSPAWPKDCSHRRRWKIL